MSRPAEWALLLAGMWLILSPRTAWLGPSAGMVKLSTDSWEVQLPGSSEQVVMPDGYRVGRAGMAKQGEGLQLPSHEKEALGGFMPSSMIHTSFSTSKKIQSSNNVMGSAFLS